MSDWTQSTIRSRASELKSGLAIGNATNNLEFWGILFGRPAAYVILVFLGGLRFITPNLLTCVSIAMVWAGSWIMWQHHELWWLSAVVLNLGLAFDCADGQLARWRGQSSYFGSYFDKVADFISFQILFLALGYVSYELTGKLYYFYFAMVGMLAIGLTGYVKWLTVHHGNLAGVAPEEVTDYRHPRSLLGVLEKLFSFNEGDMFFWIALGLILGKPHWAMWLVACSQVPIILVSGVSRGMQNISFDRPR